MRSAQRSIINAHFTPFPVINAIYDGLQKAGLHFGNLLEPSAGIGNFLAAMPVNMANRSEVTAIEMDPMTGMILRRLFPTVESKIAPLEKTRLPENHYDLVISNVPFGDTAIYDPQLEAHPDKGFSKAANNLHNYFFAKSILSTRPGGLIALLTSRFTLDSTQSSDVRELMKANCDFLGALRLPDNTFKANAGTEVVADIILLRKLEAGEAAEQKHAFQEVCSVPFTDHTGKTAIINYNEYFHDNPGNMLGTVAFGGLYNKDGFNLLNNNSNDVGHQMADAFDNMFQAPVYRPRIIQQESTATDNQTVKNFISLGDYDSIGNIVNMDASTFGIITGDNYLDPIIQEKARQAGVALHQLREGKPDGPDKLWMEKNGLTLSGFNQKLIEPIKLSKAEMEKMPLIIKLRETLKEVIFREADGWTGATLEDKRATLRETYTIFTSKFGHLTNKENDKVLGLDADGILVQSLERKDPITKAIITSDILHRPTIKPAQELGSTDNVRDAIMLSLKRKGHLDMNLVCELLDKPYGSVMAIQIGDKAEIFIDAYGKHVPREDFLSGNILQKIRAEEANLEVMQASGAPEAELTRMENNIIQLKKVLPAPIMATDIYSPLHARWLPQADIATFINSTIKTEHFGLSFSGSLDEYKLNIRSENAHSDAFKTQRRKAEWVFNHALNGIEPIVNYTDSEGRQVFDAEDTHLAKEKYRAIRNLWDD